MATIPKLFVIDVVISDDDVVDYGDTYYVFASLRIGHPHDVKNEQSNRPHGEFVSFEFRERRYSEYERAAIEFIREQERNDVLFTGSNALSPWREICTSKLERFHRDVNGSSWRQKHLGGDAGGARFGKRIPTRPQHPHNVFSFWLKINDEDTVREELQVLKDYFVRELGIIVDRIEASKQSLQGLCIRTIDRFDLNDRYKNNSSAMHVLHRLT